MATYTAASLSAADVQAAMNLATAAGDIVALPAGTGNWTSTVTWSAPVNAQLVGAGTSATGGGDVTIIQDNIASGGRLLQINAASTGTFRMTGITFRSGTGATKDGGTIRIDGPATVRLDHLRLLATSGANYKMLVLGTAVFGVLHNSLLDFSETNAIYAYNGRLGSGDWMGNYEWSLPTGFGSADFFFIEDNIITGTTGGTVYPTRIVDGFTAARVVVRFNTCVATVLCEMHATGHGGDDRGPRATEVYCNSVTSPLAKDPNYVMADLQSGCSVVWGNAANQVYKNMFLAKVVRANNATYSQSATPNGWGYAGTGFNGTGSNWDGNADAVTGYPCIDQPGRGQGQLLAGGFPSKVNSSTGTIAWPNQALEPVRVWANTGSIVSGWGGSYYSVDTSRIAFDRDFYQQATGEQTSPTSPFNGTSGVGWGTLANRPTTCTAGVAYWATDQGDWNETATNDFGVQRGGVSGKLYVATATNTWSEYYEPYTYPHPLRSGESPPPSSSSTPSPLGNRGTRAVLAGIF